MSTWSRLRATLDNWRIQGVRRARADLWATLGRREVALLYRPLAEPIPDIVPTIAVEIAMLRQDEAAACARFQKNLDEAQVSTRLRSSICFVARLDGTLIATSWATTHDTPIHFLGCGLRLAAGEAYAYDVHTAPEYRGHRIAPALAVATLRHYRDQGAQRLIGTVMIGNRSAEGKRSGYRNFGVMGRWQIGSWRWEFCRNADDPAGAFPRLIGAREWFARERSP